MATLNDLTEADVIALAEAAGEPDWLRDLRQTAGKRLADLDWPTNKVEEWRHTDPRRVALDRELVTLADSAGATDVDARAEGIAATISDAAVRVRIVDGVVAEAHVSADASARGVVATDLATAARDHGELVRERLGSVIGAEDPFTAANLAGFTVGVFVHVPADVELDQPVVVTHQVTQAGTHLPRLLVDLGAHTRADVIVDRSGVAEATVVEVLEVLSGDGAVAQVASAQDWGPGIAHVGWHRASVGRDADVKNLEATFGGDTVYLRPDVALDGRGGNGELHGVYFSTDEQRFEHRATIHHKASNTTSDSVYKGALQGKSRAVWYGNIRIEPDAKATSSDETNRNLILTDGARADSIPFLEILTSDVVACGHHSSVGQVDEMQLFYLESRGIPRPEAARMLVYAFFAEVLERVELPSVTDALLAEVDRELREAPTALMNERRDLRRGA